MVNDYINFKTAASYLCVSTSKLYKMTHKKEIPYRKMGRLNVFKKIELDDFLEDRKVLSNCQLMNLAENKLNNLYKG